MQMNWRNKLKQLSKGSVRFKEPLRRHSSFKIGGRIEAWIEPKDTDDLSNIVKFARLRRIPIFVIGKGSNVLFRDGHIKGMILNLNSAHFKRIQFRDNFIKVGAGITLNRLVESARQKNLAGCEYLLGIPGTVGGALMMNAGISRGSRLYNIGPLVENVEAMDYCGNIRIIEKDNLRFAYRKSNLGRCIILSATLKLKRATKHQIENNIAKIRRLRAATYGHPPPSIGCIFKNPKRGLSAGYLIEKSGLKMARVSDAWVWRGHANFIVNRSNATAANVIRLMSLIKTRVKKEFAITLEPEVKIVG